MRLFRNRSGFTVIEGIIVAAILGILATIAFPSVERSLLRYRADRAASAITADLQNAFALAARQRSPIRVQITNNPQRMTISDRNTGNLIYHRYYGRIESPYGATFMSSSTNPFFLFPNGLASGADTITLRVGTSQRRIVMSRVGYITILGS